MSSMPTAAQIAADARWLAQALDPAARAVRLIAMDGEGYRAASFLDDRLLQQPVLSPVVPWATISEAAAAIPRDDARWVFHIGHVGSTLIARLLGELPGVLAVREPRLLRDLVSVPASERRRYAEAATRLYSRTFAPDQVALVKATSWVSEIAPLLVPPGGRALFLFAPARTYIAGILAGENNAMELCALARGRAQRMAGRVGALPPPRHEADLASAAWACEMTSLESAADAMADRHVQWAAFDPMLADIAGALRRLCGHFAIDADPAQLQAIAGGPLMQRYSKALEYDYSASLRHDLLADAEARFRREIEDALAMVAKAAETAPLLARALGRS